MVEYPVIDILHKDLKVSEIGIDYLGVKQGSAIHRAFG